MHSKEMEEFRKKVIEAKIRLVLGLKPDDDISKAGRVVTLEEQKEELESLRREVDLLKKSLSKGGGGEVDVEKELAKVNREYDVVIKEMDSMRINFREKSNLVGDCENLKMMIGYVKGDIEGKKARMKVVEQEMAKAEEKKKEVEKEVEAFRKKQEEERRARLQFTCNSFSYYRLLSLPTLFYFVFVRLIANWEKPGEEMPSSIAEMKKLAALRKPV